MKLYILKNKYTSKFLKNAAPQIIRKSYFLIAIILQKLARSNLPLIIRKIIEKNAFLNKYLLHLKFKTWISIHKTNIENIWKPNFVNSLRQDTKIYPLIKLFTKLLNKIFAYIWREAKLALYYRLAKFKFLSTVVCICIMSVNNILLLHLKMSKHLDYHCPTLFNKISSGTFCSHLVEVGDK